MTGVEITPDEFSARLLEWWFENKRDFPWRRTMDPYEVLIAEALLRKTTAKQVERVFEELIKKYPTPSHLASADIKQLENFLRPLGMERVRARLLKDLAEAIVSRFGGKVPDDMNELTSLPGVGRYAASAVLSLSFGKNEPMMDTNFIRVIKRVFGVLPKASRPREDRRLWEFAKSLVPAISSREFNLAVIDFAAQVCRSRKPNCATCIFERNCWWAGKSVEKHKKFL